jgi:hypothetical protein
MILKEYRRGFEVEVLPHGLQAARIEKIGELQISNLRWSRFAGDLDRYDAVGTDGDALRVLGNRHAGLQFVSVGRDDLPLFVNLERSITRISKVAVWQQHLKESATIDRQIETVSRLRDIPLGEQFFGCHGTYART